MDRTHLNGSLRITDLGKEVRLYGWAAKTRNLGGIIFIDLRDKEGITQLIIHPSSQQYETAIQIKNEYVLAIKGIVRERESKNPKLPTGDIEIECTKIEILNKAENPPIIVADNTDALEDTRLKFRYLDLRRPIIQKYIVGKSKIIQSIRNYFLSKDFIELETPILAKSTPEGARDYLVPSRIYNGEFYALPQSPQIFKQLYMIGGFDRYFQFARCFRDEDLRADRQPEFTQLDLEMSFVSKEDIQFHIEQMFVRLFKEHLDIAIETPFPHYSYQDVIEKYGSDKPDTRFELVINNFDFLKSNVPFMLDDEISCGLIIKNALNRKEIDSLIEQLKSYKVTSSGYFRYKDGQFTGSLAKFLPATLSEQLILEDDDLVLIASGAKRYVYRALGIIRSQLGKKFDLPDKSKFNFLWVEDWPVFEYDHDTNEYIVSTHPFTSPQKWCMSLLKTQPERVLADAYDIVLNGYELGSGSIRIYDQEDQNAMFEAIGLSKDEVEQKFGFFTEALKYGTPPHGGIALGIERIAMIMLGTENIKDVVAFPKTQSAKDLMMESPSGIDQKQLSELGLSIKKEA